jgi:hypothetical protein
MCPEIIDPDVGEFPDDAIEGRHNVRVFSMMAFDANWILRCRLSPTRGSGTCPGYPDDARDAKEVA